MLPQWGASREHSVNCKSSYCGWGYFVFTETKTSLATRLLFKKPKRADYHMFTKILKHQYPYIRRKFFFPRYFPIYSPKFIKFKCPQLTLSY